MTHDTQLRIIYLLVNVIASRTIHDDSDRDEVKSIFNIFTRNSNHVLASHIAFNRHQRYYKFVYDIIRWSEIYTL